MSAHSHDGVRSRRAGSRRRRSGKGIEPLERRTLLSGVPEEASSPPNMAGDEFGWGWEAGEGGAQDGAGAHVFAPHSTVNGLTMGEWTARWWQWAASFPVDHTPTLDPTGELAGLGQQGPVFYLAGTTLFNSDPFVRNITVPSGKKLFAPLLNLIWVQLPGDPPWPTGRAIMDEVLRPATTSTPGTVSLGATLDGQPIGGDLFAHREVDPYVDGFSVTMPANNIFGVAPGTYSPAGADGYWLMIGPLSVGQHQFKFQANNNSPLVGGTWSQDITYNIRVVGHGNAGTDGQAAAPAAPRTDLFADRPISQRMTELIEL
jgi:hypothetical protein